MGNKKKLSAILLMCVLAAAVAVIIVGKGFSGKETKNLALMRGVKAVSDSVETEKLSAYKAIDGDDETLSSRWSSENDWEDASHYIELEFPEEISVSFVVLKWERTNVVSYQLEASLDGAEWRILKAFDSAPESRRQEIPLDEAETLKFIRLSTNDVSRNEEDYSNLYQNVSLFEFEVYADKPAAYYVEEPEIVIKEDGTRYLEMPKAPDGYKITYLGADYEQIIGENLEIYDTIQDKDVLTGFLIEDMDGKEDAEEISFSISVPASENMGKKDNAGAVGALEEALNGAPDVIPAIAEWEGGKGSFVPDAGSKLIISDETLMQTAELFAQRYRKIMGYDIGISIGKKAESGDFYLSYSDSGAAAGIGEEGYVCEINDTCVIYGTHEKGVYWGTVTALQMLKLNEGTLPQGLIRDYPRYEVRGFGIDVARKPVSMEMLYQIVENMSWYKMNDLSIHLNDNVILSTSGLTSSIQETMTAYSAFRIDTSVTNEKGEKLTAGDYFYTAEEFAEFINWAGKYGIRVVPEIDTPAHSLSITSLFPDYALTRSNETVDQIDLDKNDAVNLVKDIWREVLGVDKASSAVSAFDGADVVNIGMDEYYGDGEAYRKYMNEIISLVHEEGKTGTVRLWGSLGNMDGKTMPDTDGLQMNIWSRIWADPLSMYEDGYSIINMQNNHLYIIPGGGYDYLDNEELYINWEPEKFYEPNQSEVVPPYSPQMLGAAYMIWNDMSGSLDVGICETDLFDRFFAPLGVMSAKLWGKNDEPVLYDEYERRFERTGTAPDSNPYALKEWEDDVLTLAGEGEVITLKGKTDYVETGYEGGNGNGYSIGGDYSVSFEVYGQAVDTTRNGTGEEQILFETDTAYGSTAFKLVQAESGKVGFSREFRDYSFDYALPEGRWVSLTIQGRKNRTSLYVDGELIDTLGDDEPFSEYASFAFPLERIGSRTSAFCGMIRNIEIKAE